MVGKARRRFRVEIVKRLKFSLGTLTVRQLKRLEEFVTYMSNDVACDGCWDNQNPCEGCATFVERNRKKLR